MEESSTYQAILEEGALRGIRKFVTRLAKDRLGNPPTEFFTALESITDVDQLEEVGIEVSLSRLKSWEEVLKRLAPRKRRRRPS